MVVDLKVLDRIVDDDDPEYIKSQNIIWQKFFLELANVFFFGERCG